MEPFLTQYPEIQAKGKLNSMSNPKQASKKGKKKSPSSHRPTCFLLLSVSLHLALRLLLGKDKKVQNLPLLLLLLPSFNDLLHSR